MRGGETNLQDEIRRAKGDTIAAHATFTHHFNTFLALADQLDDRCQDIEDREEDMVKRDAQGKLEDQQLQEREKRCIEKEHEMEERAREVKAKEHQWAETESMMKASADKLPTVIKLDVSGTKFSISKEKLLQYKGSLFEQMVASSHCQQLSSGRLFIERDPKYFRYIVIFLLNGTLELLPNEHKQTAIRQEFEYFRIPIPVLFPALAPVQAPQAAVLGPAPEPTPEPASEPASEPAPVPAPQLRIRMAICDPAPATAPEPTPISPRSSFITPFRPPWIWLLYVTLLLVVHIAYISLHPQSSSLYSSVEKRSNPIAKFGDTINEWLPRRKLELIYKASVDGFSAEAFHKRCDNKGPTLTVIRSSNGYLFGGFVSRSWERREHPNAEDMFIFTLTNPYNIPPTKYLLRPHYYFGIFASPSYGPSFSYDISIPTNSHQSHNEINFPYDYVDSTGKGATTFTGSSYLQTIEIEVYSVSWDTLKYPSTFRFTQPSIIQPFIHHSSSSLPLPIPRSF